MTETYYESEPEPEPVDYSGDFGENSFSNIFGRPSQQCKPIKAISQQDLNDPLRKLKVEIKSILIANGPMTPIEVAAEYNTNYGCTLKATNHGFKNIDDLLSKFSDVCSCYVDDDGRKLYMAITDERHEDLQHLIRRQLSSGTTAKRTSRLPCSNGLSRSSSPTKSVDIPPPLDQKYRGGRNLERVASTKVIGQFPCDPNANRLQFQDEGPKCKKRCQVIANMVRKIGQKSPDGYEVRCHIETLKNYYWQQTGLSIWGKLMTNEEYAIAWQEPSLYEFWRIMIEKAEDPDRADRHFIVVPSDPSINYFNMLPPYKRPSQSMEELKETKIIFDNDFCGRSKRSLGVDAKTSHSSFRTNDNSSRTDIGMPDIRMPMSDLHINFISSEVQTNRVSATSSQSCRQPNDFGPQFTSSVNSTFDEHFCARIDLPLPDVSNISNTSSISDKPISKNFWGGKDGDNIRDKTSSEESYPGFSLDCQKELDFNELSAIRSCTPNASSNLLEKAISIVEKSVAEEELDLEGMTEQLDHFHITDKERGDRSNNNAATATDCDSSIQKDRSPKNIALSGIRIINNYVSSHARDCLRRDPNKPCNSLPMSYEDLKSRQLPPVVPEAIRNSSQQDTISTSSSSSGPGSLSTCDPVDHAVLPPQDITSALSNTSIATPVNRLIRFADVEEIYTISDVSSIDSDFVVEDLDASDGENTDGSLVVRSDSIESVETGEKVADGKGTNHLDALFDPISSEDKLVELLDMLTNSVLDGMESNNGRLCTLHSLLSLCHMLQHSAFKPKFDGIITYIEVLIAKEQKRS